MRRGIKRTTISLSIVIAAVSTVAMLSCSGTVNDPDKALDRMIKAHGGSDARPKINSYIGRGFMKKLPFIHVAESSPFDVYQKDLMVKNRIVYLQGGLMSDVRILVARSDESYSWSPGNGKQLAADWEYDLLKYRFPYVLTWLPESGLAGGIVDQEEEGSVKLQYENGDDILSLVIDTSTWLLQETEVRSKSDSSFASRDVYSDYFKVDGIWFPSRFTGYFSGRNYYEYYLTRIDLGQEIDDEFFAILPEDTLGLSTGKVPAP